VLVKAVVLVELTVVMVVKVEHQEDLLEHTLI
jgi:hypothetical protein